MNLMSYSEMLLIPIIYVSRTFVGSQKNWVTLTKEAYAIYMTHKKLLNYLHATKVAIICDDAPLHKCLTAQTQIQK